MSQRPISLQEILIELCIWPIVHVRWNEIVIKGHAVGWHCRHCRHRRHHRRHGGLAGVGRTGRVGLELVYRGRGAGLGRARPQQIVHVDVNGARRVGPRGADFRRLIVAIRLLRLA